MNRNKYACTLDTNSNIFSMGLLQFSAEKTPNNVKIKQTVLFNVALKE